MDPDLHRKTDSSSEKPAHVVGVGICSFSCVCSSSRVLLMHSRLPLTDKSSLKQENLTQACYSSQQRGDRNTPYDK